MSRPVSKLRTHFPISRIALFCLIGLLALSIPTVLMAAPPPSPPPTSYQGAPTSLYIYTYNNYLYEDVAVDSTGSIYVLDTSNNIIYVENQDYLGMTLATQSGPQGYVGNMGISYISCQSGISPTGFNNPKAMTVTGSGILYVADSGNSRVVSVNLTTGVCSVVPMGTGSTVTLVYPQGVAVSEYGDLFISDYGNNSGNNGQIVCIPMYSRPGQTAGVAYGMMNAGTIIDGNTWNGSGYNPPYVVNGIWNPGHIAWDAYDDLLFIADYGNSRILAAHEQWIYGNGGQNPFEIETSGDWNWPQNPTGSNSQRPQGIAVDSVGNLYWTDDSTIHVYELPHNGGPNPVSTNWNTTNFALNTGNQSLSGNLCNANSVYVDQWGTVYVADTGNSGCPTGHDRVITNVSHANGQTNFGAVNFYHLPLNGTKPIWQQLAFVVSNGVTVTSATAYTMGTEFLDFNVSDNSSPTCTSGFTGNGSGYCYVWVSFKPTAPGLRRGVVALYSNGEASNGVQIASVPVFGVGTAPEAEFFPAGYGATISTGTLNTLQPMQIALDGNNNMFVANYSGDSVIEVPPAGGTAQVIAAPSGGTVTYPEQAAGVAVDGAGNLFISDHQGSVIWVANPLQPYWGFTPLIIDGLGSTPLNQPMEINFDPAGNLYIADWGNNRVVEVSGLFINVNDNFEGRGTVVSTNGYYLGQGYNFWGGTGLRSVTGVAVDPLMNVYITDSVLGNIVTAPQSLNQIAPGYQFASRLKWPYSSSNFVGVSGVFNLPQGLTTDGMGNLYVADAGNKRIVAGNFNTLEFGNRSTGFGVTVASNVATPGPLGNNLFGVAVDPWGNVFVPDYANNRIAAYYPTTPPTENFASTYVTLTSSDSAKTAQLWNIGNETLTFLRPSTGLNPSISANFTYGATSTCTQIGTSGNESLIPAAGCTIIDSFVPQVVGSITGSIIATDNNLYPAGWTPGNASYTTQTIPLAGTGLFDFAFSVPNPQSAVLNPGGTATFNFTITPVGQATFLAPVSFTVTGAPTTNGASVTFTPSNIAIGANATNVVMTVVAPSILTTENRQPENLGRKLAPISFALLLLPLLGVRRMRKTWQRYLMLLIMLVGGFAATTAMSGCSTTPSGYFGQGTTYDYTIYVTGTGLGVSHTVSGIVITVN